MRLYSLLVSFGAVAMLSGCMQMPLTYQPSIDNLEVLRSSKAAPMNVGKFSLAADKPTSMDKTVSARGSTVVPPNDSFSLFLKEAIKQELVNAGKFDPNSNIVINGQLTNSSLEAPIGTGKGEVSAKFTVDRDNKLVYEKELKESAEWSSAFMGADAIPTAMTQYASLYKKLIGRLFGDKNFQEAVKTK